MPLYMAHQFVLRKPLLGKMRFPEVSYTNYRLTTLDLQTRARGQFHWRMTCRKISAYSALAFPLPLPFFLPPSPDLVSSV